MGCWIPLNMEPFKTLREHASEYCHIHGMPEPEAVEYEMKRIPPAIRERLEQGFIVSL